MAVYQYRKFKVSLRPDTKKSQGLKTGDIVRRQYFDGKNLIYSLMCVLSNGTEEVVNSETNEVEQRSYFIGALLEGDVPQTEELLDFARITNLFDEDRSGALYLTASDDQAPYMDVIDGIGRNASLCWPESIGGTDYQDASSQYILINHTGVTSDYTPTLQDNNRILHISVEADGAGLENGINQEFYQFVENPNRVLISYKIRSNKACQASVSLGYINGVHSDGSETVNITTDWAYHFHAITVDWSGRHLRTVKLSTTELSEGDMLEIADFNIILLSSVTNFGDASQIRVGKLDGIVDPVFGNINKYGGYFQKLFVTGSAHVSGTLTAGDENGFSSTFYAGKIHRNVFKNSLDVDFNSNVILEKTLTNPTGVGNIYLAVGDLRFYPQDSAWLSERVGKLYTFSFWCYVKAACTLYLQQNGKSIGTIVMPYTQTHKWVRKHLTFKLQEPTGTGGMLMIIHPEYTDYDNNGLGVDSSVLEAELKIEDSHDIYFTAPQLESGELVTQYQPTDGVLNDTEDYGAWFSRGGIGGTIQNPLLQLNFDGDGSIGTRTDSFRLKVDGSGWFAKKNIQWDKDGKVTFGDQVTLNWGNMDDTIKQQLLPKSIRITGTDTFTAYNNESLGTILYSPQSLTFELEEENISSTSSQRQWYYLQGKVWKAFSEQNSKSLTITPDEEYWNSDTQLTIKCEVTVDDVVYSDMLTVHKQFVDGYSIKITSSQGEFFKNGLCSTVLSADIYYQGKLMDSTYADGIFKFDWKKYDLPDTTNESQDWWKEQYDSEGNKIQDEIDTTKRTITLGYKISGSDLFTCDLQNNGSVAFSYTFPIIF